MSPGPVDDSDEIRVRIVGLQAGYGPQTVVHGLDLHVGHGEIVGLLGRNGAGKSTTLKAVAGLLSGVAGQVIVDGQLISGSAYKRTQSILGLVPEGRSVFPSLTVSENLDVARADLDEACRLFPELTSRLSIRSGLLSGGEQQMLALARAIVRRPRLLLIDELSFGLSQRVSLRLLSRLRDYVRETGMSVILVEQHMSAMSKVADRVYIMQEGRIMLELPQAEIMSRGEEIRTVYLTG
ncbi:MAG: ATP-binding cassette domain-containing protein [Acidimicrobiales bacterium]|nr:ATP-binding cassette domain-containing protein [Acidimicrobiales bacterium]